MQKMIGLFFILFFLGFGIVGCNSESNPEAENGADATPFLDEISSLPTKVSTIESEPTNPSLATATPTPTTTELPPPTNEPTSTSIPTPTSIEVQELCGTVHSDASEIPAEMIEGVVIEAVIDDQQSVAIQGKDVNAFAFVQPIAKGIWTTNVSPNGEWLAHTEAVELDENGYSLVDNVVVFNPNSGESFQIHVQNEFVPKFNLSGFRWLNDSQLINHTIPTQESSTMTYMIWSPFTGETQILSVQLPGYEHLLFGGTVYPTIDPLLEYIMYPCYNEDVCENKDFRVQEITSGEEVWATESEISQFEFPRNVYWSPDGNYVVIPNKPAPDLVELNIYDRNGEKIYEKIMPSLGFGGNLEWSPDGKYLLFKRTVILTQSEQPVVKWSLINLVTDEVFYLCLPNTQGIYWSPDSTKFVTKHTIRISEDPEEWSYILFVVDVASGDIYRWDESNRLFLLGWAAPILEP